MTSPVLKNIIRFALLVLIQVFLLNKIQFNGYINPYFYVLFILSLPFTIRKWFLLVLGFLLGISIDYFSGTLGIHAAATVFMAFCRPGIIRLLGVKDDLEPGIEPSIRNFGFLWYFTYSGSLVFLHHLVLFYLEVFRFSEFFSTFLRVILSSIFSLVFILIAQYLFYRKK